MKILLLLLFISSQIWGQTPIGSEGTYYVEKLETELHVEILLLSLLFSKTVTTADFLQESKAAPDIINDLENIPSNVDFVYRGYTLGLMTGILQIPLAFIKGFSSTNITLKSILFEDMGEEFHQNSKKQKEEILVLSPTKRKMVVGTILEKLKQKLGEEEIEEAGLLLKALEDPTLLDSVFIVLEQTEYDVINAFTSFSETEKEN